MINNVRGWFPSNYCAVVSGSDDPGELGSQGHNESDTSGDSGAEQEDYKEHDDDVDSDSNARDEDPYREEAEFWIPQATPDGRLFYFNTLTGVSTIKLPLETPTSTNETGPHDRTREAVLRFHDSFPALFNFPVSTLGFADGTLDLLFQFGRVNGSYEDEIQNKYL